MAIVSEKAFDIKKAKINPCPFCGGPVRVYPGVPKLKWSVSFACKGSCQMNMSHSTYRFGSNPDFKPIYQNEYLKQRLDIFNKAKRWE